MNTCSRFKLCLALGVSTIGLAAMSEVNAATVVTWQSAVTITGSDDVNTQGTQVFGRCISTAFGGSTTNVNGVEFGYNNPNFNAVGFSENWGTGGFGSNIAGQSLTGSDVSDYQTVLGTTRGLASGTGTLSFSSLTIGQQYLIQFWVADYRAFPNVRTETISADGGNVGIPTLHFLDQNGSIHGQYVIGTFTAETSNIVFSISGNEGPNYSAVQLRAIPEPSVALLGGLGVLGLLRRRRA